VNKKNWFRLQCFSKCNNPMYGFYMNSLIISFFHQSSNLLFWGEVFNNNILLYLCHIHVAWYCAQKCWSTCMPLPGLYNSSLLGYFIQEEAKLWISKSVRVQKHLKCPGGQNRFSTKNEDKAKKTQEERGANCFYLLFC
jgi:hypothetical protein